MLNDTDSSIKTLFFIKDLNQFLGGLSVYHSLFLLRKVKISPETLFSVSAQSLQTTTALLNLVTHLPLENLDSYA